MSLIYYMAHPLVSELLRVVVLQEPVSYSDPDLDPALLFTAILREAFLLPNL